MASLKRRSVGWLCLVICVVGVYSEVSTTMETATVGIVAEGGVSVSASEEDTFATVMSVSTSGKMEPEVSEIPSSTVPGESTSVVVTSGPTEMVEGLTTGFAVELGSSAASLAEEGEIEKKGDIELESETPVISFGIRSFTVEVGTGTERSSDEPVLMNATQPENATQQSAESASTTQVNFSSESLGDVASTATATTVESISTTLTGEFDHVENTAAEGPTQDQTSDSVVTINTKLTNEKPINMDDSGEEQHLSNEIRVEKKNGLYRIKIAEITTDEFDNGLHESDNENMLMPADVVASKSVYPSKINIDDFYPSKLEDFKPSVAGGNAIQREVETQEKLLREKAILRNDDNEKLFESTIMKPSEVLPVIDSRTDGSDEDRNEGDKRGQDNGDISTTKIEIELIDDTSETSTSDEGKSSIDNITEKLEENDEVISRIEENFKGYKTFDLPEEEEPTPKKKDDEVITIAISSVTFSSSQQLSTQAVPTLTPISGTTTQTSPEEVPIAVSGSDIVKGNYGNLFIQRRVKKNDPTTAKLNAFDSVAPLKKIDFANTKFNTDNSGPPHDPKDANKKDKPEFSTTKFYNSKELYSELHHQMMNDSDHRHPNRNSPVVPKKTTAIVSEKDILTAKTLFRPAAQSTVTTKKLPPKSVTPTSEPIRLDSNIKKQLLKTNFIPREESHPPTGKPQQAGVSHAPLESTSVNRPLHPQDQQKKIRTLGAAASAIIAATSKLTKNNSKARIAPAIAPGAASPQLQQQQQQHQQQQQRKPQPSTSRLGENLITRPVITPLSRLQEKINTLDCDIQAVSPDSTIWRGNETHDLNLPITVAEENTNEHGCKNPLTEVNHTEVRLKIAGSSAGSNKQEVTRRQCKGCWIEKVWEGMRKGERFIRRGNPFN